MGLFNVPTVSSGGEPAARSQLGAPGARVLFDLPLARCYGTARQDFNSAARAASADGRASLAFTIA